ncbi:MAG: histidinol-phosphatase [Corynebacterium sp.]|uniref:histidinol-phosphatase n=1 Tax=Corynebacterium sp. TaxID=1720 RepID=UPI0026DC53FE|nr:histidinol-phosphatase [Corynebacterium sp.]MDO4761203.1 histidinol-phosphatase [Corynebacterium sp.]
MYSNDLALALRLADAADAITLARFEAADLKVDSKPDMTPVSDADTSCERALRALIETHRPDDEILGEEYGGTPQTTGRQWVIDPIDGTKNYVRGVPVWATLIALLDNGRPVVGVISAPALNRRWWASLGEGAYKSYNAQTTPIHVSGVTDIADASVSFSSLDGWRDRGLLGNFLTLADTTWRLRAFGDFYSYCLVAEGAVDIACEPEVSLWDLAPLAILVQEAGGRFTSLNNSDGPHDGSAVATNGKLHETTLNVLTHPAATAP